MTDNKSDANIEPQQRSPEENPHVVDIEKVDTQQKVHFKEKLRRVVEDTDTTAGRIFDIVMMVMILFTIVALSFDTLPDLDPRVRAFFASSEIFITLFFTVEYLLRVYVAKPKRDYVFSFYGIIDFLAVFPFYLELILGVFGFNQAALRVVRLLRLLRLLKIARYNKAMDRFRRAFIIAREELALYLFMAASLIFLSSLGIYHYEHEAQPEAFKSAFHSMWWALVTLTTVGYGDVYPITAAGRVFTFVVLMCGLGVVAIPAGLLASALSQARDEEMEARLAELTNNPVGVIRPEEYRTKKSWEPKPVATIQGVSARMYWTEEAYPWTRNDDQEVLVVLNGEVEMQYRLGDEIITEALKPGDTFYANSGTEHRAKPIGEARVLVVERSVRGSF